MAFHEVEAVDVGLADLLQRAASGEDVVLTAGGVPQARLVPIPQPPGGKRKLGALAGLGTVPSDFDDPLSDEVVALFENR